MEEQDELARILPALAQRPAELRRCQLRRIRRGAHGGHRSTTEGLPRAEDGSMLSALAPRRRRQTMGA